VTAASLRLLLFTTDPRVARVALDAGAEVISATPHRVSLESIFLSTVSEAGSGEDSR